MYLHPRWWFNNQEELNNMDANRAKTLVNFKKARSHIDRIIQMIEDGEYCIDVMQQNLAVVGLLKSAHQMLMEGHLHTCFSNAMNTSNVSRKKKMVEEILAVSKLANKT
jgi:CsoR family transcriptional regulator, copper-sensing transcriptional repressor